MDDAVKNIMREYTPEINPMIANGLAMVHIPLCEQYCDNVMRAAAKDFPPNLKYHGFTRCTPKEEFEESTRARGSSRRFFETARSNLYLVKYQFSWKGVMLPPRHVYLPFEEQAGAIRLSGVKFYVSPVLADKIISLSTNSVFIRLLRDKLVFARRPHDMLVDDCRTSVQIVHSEIYHRSAAMRKLQRTVNMETSLVHYLLCKYGTIGMFEKFGGVTPHIGTAKEITNELYPADQWVICRSSGLKPRGFGRKLYTGADVSLAIPRHQWNLNVQSLVGGFYYVVDHFPTRIQAQWLQPEYAHEQRLWIVLMGHILFSGNINEATLYEDICTHLRSLDDYVDSLVEIKLKELGYNCHDIYDLMGVIIGNYNEWMVGSSGKINSLHGKELSILPDLLFAITSGIFKFLFKIRSASERKDLSEKEVMTIMAGTIRMGAIYSVTKSGMSNNIVSTESYSGDNKFFKITSMMVPQAKSNKSGGKKRQRVNMKDPSMHLHASYADVGSYSYLPKSDPTGKSRINPHLELTPQAEVVRSKKHEALIDSVQEMIKRS